MSSSTEQTTPESTSSSKMTEPSSPDIAAAEELELSDDDPAAVDGLEDVSDVKDATTGSSLPIEPGSNVAEAAPVKPKSKVRAAAAMLEQGTTKTPKDRPSPAGSFRSIPVSSHSSPHKLFPDRLGSPSPAFSSRSLSKSPRPLELSSPFVARSTSPVNLNSTDPVTVERFSDVSLTDSPSKSGSRPSPSTQSTPNYSLSPAPPPVDLTEMPPESVVTPPAKDQSSVTSFFTTSTLGFGFPTTSLSAEPTSLQPSRSTSTSSQGGTHAAGTWRSTVTNLLSGSRSISSTSPLPTPSASLPHLAEPSSSKGPAESSHNTSTGLLLHRVELTSASRDRRISQQTGGPDKIREGFERVRGEMESAAREMRRERESKATTAGPTEPDDPDGMVDWVFWGAVVQDFEEVARTRPKELSKAIQQGIPPVIRGAIWQLMSSSKSTALEDTYKALLKLTSPHEKAIAKDINRTFPNHKFFQEGGGLGQEGLFMVVKAYSIYDQEVGYTQGLAFIVAALLLNMPDEEAFCVLVRLMDSYNLRSHYTAEMQGLQLRLFQFDRLVEDILPLIHTHFARKGIKSSMYASQWFMTLFSYRFPLSLVYRVLDIVFAEGIEAIFRFSLALLQLSEDKLIDLEFEQILNYLQSDLFEVYRTENVSAPEAELDLHSDEEWKANEFVRDAYEIRITPFMLDSYASEWEEQCRSQNRHALEVDQLRNANRNLSSQVNQLEASLATMNQEHVELVRQLVMCKIEKEETENELVRYKMLYAEMAHAQQDALSTHSRLSGGSLQSSSKLQHH
ncbi:hypothetical protein IAR55_006241 [Kwoniella newhampshirensis]|uniref:GTPase-activating protein GYP5 n=1 Tax=Kwoniella newhampshirensis TaxID=1651941 RepID=A0AAW0YGJ5_9TREE